LEEWIEKGDELSFSIIYNTHVNNLFSYGRAWASRKKLQGCYSRDVYPLTCIRKRMEARCKISPPTLFTDVQKQFTGTEKERSMKEEAIDSFQNV